MKTLIAGNWKMHGCAAWTDKIGAFEALLPAQDRSEIDVLICPPFPYIASLAHEAQGVNIHIGGQDCHWNVSGAHTGETSATMLKDVGASYVIIGHSERRAAGESDAQVKDKAVAALEAGLTPIICVGETLEHREAGHALGIVEAQLKNSLPDTDADIVIAYEPVWAIGTGKTATEDDIAEMHAHIRGLVGDGLRILYGGSVKPANAKAILSTANVNGALIGGASLKMADFSDIAKSA